MKRLEKRIVYLATNSPNKKNTFEKRIMPGLINEDDYGGSLTEASACIFDEKSSVDVRKFTSSLMIEPTSLLISNGHEKSFKQKNIISADTDATFKTGTALLLLAVFMSEQQEYHVKKNGKVVVEEVIGMDTMSAWVYDEQLLKDVEMAITEEDKRLVVHDGVKSGKIEFNNKAMTEVDLEMNIKKMHEAIAVVDETVVKGAAIIYGVDKTHKLSQTGYSSSAFLSIHRIIPDKKQDIERIMRLDWKGISSGFKTQCGQDCLEEIYMGRLKTKDAGEIQNQEIYDSLSGMPWRAVQDVLCETDQDVRKILALSQVEISEHALLN